VGGLRNKPVAIDGNGDEIKSERLNGGLKNDESVGPLIKTAAAVDAASKTLQDV